MLLSITPTDRCQKIEGQNCRLWEGTDDAGTPVHVWVRCISPQTHDPERLKAFDEKLNQLPPLRKGAIDYRFIVD